MVVGPGIEIQHVSMNGTLLQRGAEGDMYCLIAPATAPGERVGEAGALFDSPMICRRRRRRHEGVYARRIVRRPIAFRAGHRGRNLLLRREAPLPAARRSREPDDAVRGARAGNPSEHSAAGTGAAAIIAIDFDTQDRARAGQRLHIANTGDGGDGGKSFRARCDRCEKEKQKQRCDEIRVRGRSSHGLLIPILIAPRNGVFMFHATLTIRNSFSWHAAAKRDVVIVVSFPTRPYWASRVRDDDARGRGCRRYWRLRCA